MREYGANEDLRALGKQLSAELSSRSDIKGIEVYHGGSSVEIEDFLEEASKGNENIPFFGSEMQTIDFERYDDKSCRNFFKEMAVGIGNLFIMNQTVQEIGLVLVLYSGEDLHVRADAVFGWKTLGRELTVNDTKDEFVVSTINEMPATEIYHKYLQVLPDEYFLFNICEFPLVL